MLMQRNKIGILISKSNQTLHFDMGLKMLLLVIKIPILFFFQSALVTTLW